MPNPELPLAADFGSGLARPNWGPGGPIDAHQLRMQQLYSAQRLRRHLRLAHGWGVICGLNVVVAGQGDPWSLLICPGYGVSPCGDEILVSRALAFNPRDYLWSQPIGAIGARVWISIDAVEDAAAYLPSPPPVCGYDCAESSEQVSRVADSCRVSISWTAPQFPHAAYNVCAGSSPPFPTCPQTCGLPLATVDMPAPDQPIRQSAIDNKGAF